MISICEPSDGFTGMEKIFLKQEVIFMYRAISDPDTRFIVMAHFELGYTQHELAQIFQISQVAISQKIKNIQKALRKMKTDGEL